MPVEVRSTPKKPNLKKFNLSTPEDEDDNDSIPDVNPENRFAKLVSGKGSPPPEKSYPMLD